MVPWYESGETMKKLLHEFRDFAFNGNLVELAVAFILALKFADVVTSFVDDIVMQVIAAIVGKPDFRDVTFDIGDATIRVGSFITVLIAFLLVAAVLYFVVKAYEQYQERRGMKKDDGGPSEEILLLREIRDSLRTRQ
jgi:large conductance mechanosensitive channel